MAAETSPIASLKARLTQYRWATAIMSSGSEYKEGSSHLAKEEDKGIIKASLHVRFFVQFLAPFF